MTPIPPSSSDGSQLPPRNRPSLGNLNKDSGEIDLWAFDEDDAPAKAPASPAQEPSIPPQRAPEGAPPPENTPHQPPRLLEKRESIRTNIGAKRRHQQSGAAAPQAPDMGDFDELDQWEIPEIPAVPAPAPVSRETVVDAPPPAVTENPEPVAKEEDELEPVPKPAPVAPAVPKPSGPPWTQLEKIGLCSLAALLLIGGGVAYWTTIHRLPRAVENTRPTDFPVEGKHLKVLSAETFWRKPVTEGPEADTFRRDSVLLPELVLTTDGRPATIRVFFRDGEGKGIGDAVTRTVGADGKVRVTATAGFEDVGMHAAYRIGTGKRWTVEVVEGAAGATSHEKLFKMNLSSDLH